MLYGQNLPWRQALRHASRRSPNRIAISSYHTARLPSRCVCEVPARSLPRCAHPRRLNTLPSTLRSFSATTARRKDKPSDPPEPAPADEETTQRSKESKDETSISRDEAESEEAKTKTPDPIPSNNSADGAKGATAGGGSGSSGDSNSSSGEGRGKKRKAPSSSTQTPERSLTKPTIPEVYPQVMAIPITKRPLFPGWYKAITVRDPNVIAAIQEMVRRGQPYVGAFLLKDEKADKDTIDNVDEVYDVGTFCQITSKYDGASDQNGQTVVLYPHRRIRLTGLMSPNKEMEEKGEAKAAMATIEAVPEAEESKDSEKEGKEAKEEKKGDVVASFEESTAEAKEQQLQLAKRDESAEVQQQPSRYQPSSFLSSYNVSVVKVDNVTEEPYDSKDPNIRAFANETANVFREIAGTNPLFKDQIASFMASQGTRNVTEDPGRLADLAAAVCMGEPAELQEVLSAMNISERALRGLTLLKKELMSAQLQTKIAKEVEGSIHEKQRKYYLMEQYKAVGRELGYASDGKDKLIEKFKEKAAKLAMPDAVSKVFDEEVNKLGHLEPAASEFNVTRNYLDWLTQIPWGQRSAENFGIQHAMKVLDEDHHGLKDVKDRILEFIAVGKLRGTVEGKILCMVGPPGVGKTSIGKSIARALNRQYYRFSVGGLTDVAEIKGHRRTYVGALPGRIIQALKKCQTENPLVLIDEVDKIGRGHQGDPSSALLELLDPEQNNSFLDHYMDVPVDLSKVLFVCTANMTDTIPRPLLDRMEMIELSGYVADEKMAIAERYLSPQAKELSGLKDVDVQLEEDAIQELINKYCRESGVRNLKKQIEKVYRKSALKIIQDLGEEVLPEAEALTAEGKAAAAEAAKDESDVKETPQDIDKETTETPRVALKVPDTVHVSITKDNLKDYVGPPVFTTDRLYDTTPAGVAMGLAWTQMGGSALYVESILETALSHSSRPSLSPTGNLKAVMKESTAIAYSFSKSVLARQFPGNKFFEHARIHLHCPEGAVRKDGPSAGITMASSLLSLALDTPLDPTIAMTGELTVTGKVLRIGGLREKTVAARRAGAKMILFPKDNLSDWLELPENIKQEIEGKPVDWYSDVFETIFPDVDHEHCNDLWKQELKKPSKDNERSKESEDDD
ncbi:ATP-dependent protease La [Rhizodiscina lignyota]|uniref:Lon protease homolog, mitochondrial n=1 Tax=Rhizodiscina lignyota TaxID=1504668 RepID=A0A9P4I5W5_9PEZI|nr:ATP-dependent protease La [Rhizodiscina lignyota]